MVRLGEQLYAEKVVLAADKAVGLTLRLSQGQLQVTYEDVPAPIVDGIPEGMTGLAFRWKAFAGAR